MLLGLTAIGFGLWFFLCPKSCWWWTRTNPDGQNEEAPAEHNTSVDENPEEDGAEEDLTVLKGVDHKVSLPIESRTDITHDTAIFRLSLPSESHTLGYPVGYHIKVFGEDKDGEEIKRSYTPITTVDQKGFVDILVKIYRPCEKFPEGGLLTTYLDTLKTGDEMTISGPIGKHKYLGAGKFDFTAEEREATCATYSMVAGGTGITPFYQIIQHVLKSETPGVPTLNLVFANKSSGDILLREQLEKLAEEGKINLTLTIDSEEEGWEGHVGFVNKELLEEKLPAPSDDHIVMYCGPKPMNEHVRGILLDIGHAENNVLKY